MSLSQGKAKSVDLRFQAPLIAKVITAAAGCGYFVLLFSVLFELRIMYATANAAWYLGLAAIVLNCVALTVTRQKRFIAFLLLGLLVTMTAGYIRGGGEGKPLPYPARLH